MSPREGGDMVRQPVKRATAGKRDALSCLGVISPRLYQTLTLTGGTSQCLSPSQSVYHIIFSTKDRRPLITDDFQPRLYDYIGGIIRGTDGISLGINGAEDHVHVLAKLRPESSTI